MADYETIIPAPPGTNPLDTGNKFRYEMVALASEYPTITAFLPFPSLTSQVRLVNTRLPLRYWGGVWNMLPGVDWYIARTEPDMIYATILDGEAWQAHGTSALYQSIVMRVKITGFYKIKIKCSYFMFNSADVAGAHYYFLNNTPVVMGLFLMKAPSLRIMQELSNAQIGAWGSTGCAQVLCTQTDPFAGAMFSEDVVPQQPFRSTGIPSVDLIVSLAEGEVLAPFIGFYSVDNNSRIDLDLLWDDVVSAQAPNGVLIVNKPDVIYQDAGGMLSTIFPMSTSFGYELLQ